MSISKNLSKLGFVSQLDKKELQGDIKDIKFFLREIEQNHVAKLSLLKNRLDEIEEKQKIFSRDLDKKLDSIHEELTSCIASSVLSIINQQKAEMKNINRELDRIKKEELKPIEELLRLIIANNFIDDIKNISDEENTKKEEIKEVSYNFDNSQGDAKEKLIGLLTRVINSSRYR